MLGVLLEAARWLWDVLAAWFWILVFCGFLGLLGVAFVPLLVLAERLEDRYGEGGDEL